MGENLSDVIRDIARAAAQRDPFVDVTKTGIFRDHRCARCSDGAHPERCPTPDRPGNCGELQARND
jgi:hypothetical protein